MAKEIDEKVVSMKFDNKNFMENTSETMTRLEKLKNSLRLPGASKGLDEVNKAANNVKLGPLGEAAEQVSLKFSALQVMAVTALSNITNSAVNAGKRIVAALTIDPIKTGLQEYETQINAVQTILANTESKGTTIDDVNKALDELNAYADKTIYNFTEMTRNIGTFTAAGVDLDTSVNAIQGIANLAAVSGSNSQQASTAMYQLSQALASGTVKLMDWNSVVNAGMGGQVFQDALKETARVHGIAIDDMIESNGSFRETLQEGWLTSEILIETLQKFTLTTEGLTEEQIAQNRAMLKAKGYTDEQIDNIFKLGATATDAATKVKTFTQLIDTMKESVQSGWTQTWEILIGDFEEAKELWTSVSDVFSKIIGDSAEARNSMLQGWSDGGGRNMAIEAIKNAFQALVSVVKPIKEAFREIFPRTTSEQLIKVTERIKEFTSKLILNEEAQKKLKSTFKGLFAAIDIVVTVIGKLVAGADKLISSFAGIIGSVIGVTGSFGDWISGIRDSIKESDLFGRIIDNIVGILQTLIEKIKTVISYLSDKFVSPGFEGFFGLITAIGNVVKFVADKVMQVISTLGSGLLDAFRNGDFKSAMDLFNSGIIAAILLSIKKFTDGFTGSLDKISKIGENVSGILGSVKECFKAFQQDLQAKTLLKIASAIAILAVAILIIASIEPSRLTASLGAITIMFSELMYSMVLFTRLSVDVKAIMKTSIAMIAMTTSILILASALKKISSIEPKSMIAGVLGVAALSAIVVAVAKTMSANEKIVLRGAASLIAFSIAIKILASACKNLSTISWGGLAKGLIGVGALMAAVSVFLNNTKLFKMGAISTAVSMAIMAAAIEILASACEDFSAMKWAEIGRGLTAMAASLVMVTIAMNLMPKNMMGIGIGLLEVSASLLILATALSSMGGMSWEEVGKSLIVLGSALAILAISLNLMAGTLAGAAALLVATLAIGMLAVALTMMVPALLAFSVIDMGAVFGGLLKLSGTLLLLGLASIMAAPFVLLLGIALKLLGAGALLAGAGLLSLSAGLTAFSAAFSMIGPILLAGITGIVTTLIGMIPAIIAAIGNGIILICKTIAGSVGAICEAIAAIIIAVCNAIIKATPKIFECLGKLLEALLAFIIKYTPKLIDAGIKIILAFLDGIAQNIDKVVEKAVLVVTKFIGGISSQVPVLVNAAFDFILKFINGISNAIEEYTPLIMEAAVNLGVSIVEGVVKGLASIPGAIWNGIKSVGNSILNGFKSFFGINSPAKSMIPIGQGLDEGIVVGLEQYKGLVVDASEDVGESAIKSMSNAISGISDVINTDIDSQPVISPVLDLSNIESGASAINGMFGMTPSVGVLSNVSAIGSMMNSSQNGVDNDVVSAINDLGSKIDSKPGNTYIIDGITYDDGSNVASAVESIVRAARIERRI